MDIPLNTLATDFLNLLVNHRGSISAFLLFVFLCVEYLIPFMALKNIWQHRFHNIALGVFNAFITYLLLPVSLYALAENVAQSPWHSLFNTQHWLWQLACLILLDCAIYWQHRLSHKIPLLWRLHRVHHTDIKLNTTSALRFHTLEILLSLVLKALLIVILLPHPITYIAFEIILNSMALFNHSNMKLPQRLETIIRFFFVTPAMHRIHHSPIKNETNSNYGFNLSFWDRLFNSYNAHSSQAPGHFTFGVETFRSDKAQRFYHLIMQPFK